MKQQKTRAARFALCSVCGRLVRIQKNRFGDKILGRHKMARCWDDGGQLTLPTLEDFAPGANLSYAATYELDCPGQGEPAG
jgi:hypothetical protein